MSCPVKRWEWAVTPLCWGLSLLTVAQRIIEMREHTVELSCGELEELDQCRVRVQAVPMDILLPSALEVGPVGPHAMELPWARCFPCLHQGTATTPELWGQSCPGTDWLVPPTDQADSEQQEHPYV